MRPFLPSETANYIPSFIATMYILEYGNEHGINIYENKKTIRNTEKITIKEKTAFEHISDFFDYSRDSIKSLNPSYIHGIVPGNNKNELSLPIKLVDSFVMQEEEFYAFVKSEFDKREKPLPDLYSIDSKLVYKVKYGEFLGKIARKFGVKVSDIKRWNNLKNDNIRENQKLIIFPKRIPKN
jgi:membrane-bound lytic murein transglycosylase D